MTKEQLAEILNGREYREEITREEEAQAKDSGLVVVFGASDDLMEFRGAIHNEADVWDGGVISLNRNGSFRQNEDGEFLKDDEGIKIEAVWCPENEEGNIYASWVYKTDIPNASFDIFEDGDLYCRGIVFEMKSLKKKMTGIELVAEERREQIEKHGYTLEHDQQERCAKELAFVAAALIESEFQEGIDLNSFPDNWNRDILQNMLSKPYKDRLIVSAALLVAEIDRLNSYEQ